MRFKVDNTKAPKLPPRKRKPNRVQSLSMSVQADDNGRPFEHEQPMELYRDEGR